MNDKEALKFMRKNNPKGLEFLHRKYSRRVRTSILFLLKNKQFDIDSLVNDICNDTFFQFYQTITYFKEKCSVITWLNTLAYQETIKTLRKIDPHNQNPLANNPIEKFILETENFEKQDCYQYCIRTYISSNTTPIYKNCLDNLTFLYEGYSIEEIAKKMKRTFSATTTFLSSCRKTFKQDSLLNECWEDCNKN
jgi:DNA-directed RNA polymerase specialized sigma24 family protein